MSARYSQWQVRWMGCGMCSWTRLRLGFPVLEVEKDKTLVGVVIPESQLDVTCLRSANTTVLASVCWCDDCDGTTTMAFVTCDRHIALADLNHMFINIFNIPYLCLLAAPCLAKCSWDLPRWLQWLASLLIPSVYHVYHPSVSVGARNVHQRQLWQDQWIYSATFKLLETCPGSIYIRIQKITSFKSTAGPWFLCQSLCAFLRSYVNC